MGLITEILGYVRGGGDTDTMTGCETALSRLQAERTAATAALETGGARRRALLIEDATDKQIAALEREIDAYRLTLERLELIEDGLISRMQVLRSGHRHEMWLKLYKRHAAAAAEYVAKHRSAARALSELRAISDESRAAGFEHETQAHFIPAPDVLSMALIANFESEVERIADAVSGRSRPAPVQPAPRARPVMPPKPATVGTPRRVFADERPALAPTKKREKLVEVPGHGEVAVDVMRDGYESPSGKQCVRGDRVALPADMARIAVANGSVDYASGEVSA